MHLGQDIWPPSFFPVVARAVVNLLLFFVTFGAVVGPAFFSATRHTEAIKTLSDEWPVRYGKRRPQLDEDQQRNYRLLTRNGS